MTSTTPSGADRYPVEWEADVILRDGSTTHLRPITPQDADALQAFHVAQSERSIYLRFFAPLKRLSERDLDRFTHVDHTDRVALIAVASPTTTAAAPLALTDGTPAPDERILGVARFDRITPDEAEVAFNIADSVQGRGLGSVLLEHVAAAARERGVRRFTAEVLPQNTRMLAVFREAGYEVSQRVEDGIVAVSFDLDQTERSRTVMAERERRAEARSVQGLLEVSSVVVVTDPQAPAGSPVALLAERAVESLVATTRLVARGAAAAEDDGQDDGLRIDVVGLGGASRLWNRDEVTYHASLDELRATGRTVDLAVVALDAAATVESVRDLAHLGTRGVVVLDEGFAETGSDGLALQRDLLHAARTAGMRIVGPGSYGLARLTGEVPVAATIAASAPAPGRIGLFCQSSPTAVTLLATFARRGLGLSTFLSAGNRADVSGNDLMQFWHEDPETDVVCLYLESIGNPRKFSRIARRLATVKPVVVVTAGRSGQVVPPGHAVRASSAPRRTLEEMLRQSGVIRVENTHQMADVAQLLDTQPLPTGRRVGIVTSSAALASLVAEAASSAGLVVTGHVGIVGESADDETAAAIVAEVADGDVDALVAVDIPVLGLGDGAFTRAVARAAARTGRTTVASVLGRHGLVPELAHTADDGRRVQVPAYATPEDAVLALASVARYATWRERDHGEYLRPEANQARALALAESWTHADEEVRLDAAQVAELLGCYGIAVEPSVEVRDAEEGIAAAERLGWPVALKNMDAALRHRQDLGGVRLGLQDADDLREAFAAMRAEGRERLGAEVRLEAQAMVPAGVACVVRTVEDPLFGPVVAFGLAGDAIDLLGDVSYGIPPLTDVDVDEMVRSVKAAPKLFGYQGLAPMDTAAVEDVLARASRLADDLPVLRSLELYPVVVGHTGARVLQARATLGRTLRPDESRRAMPAPPR
ncbi:GNAT family N-acetyltransferase [Sanguibacter sp. HDW7]|uniref:bifunctional acetate--CoA ligase family protein/GNAT family N-acetyltransferase n=1 Tax=Sanguibacter sp. HDW7 TaxID=2714931 RepID=UPI00140DE979|nr:GNAT family N-acetyltransferase [Sanguibacter sp. HDW7]QIK83669.1 GNAT family N-acetyltransferase [Sanguibacter sp. HDW7]